MTMNQDNIKDSLIIHDLRKENAILRKVNADLLEAMEKILTLQCNEDKLFDPIVNTCQSAINAAANDMRFGITEKKEGE